MGTLGHVVLVTCRLQMVFVSLTHDVKSTASLIFLPYFLYSWFIVTP